MTFFSLASAVLLALASFDSVAAVDAVSVDASGGTTFNYPVKGPYLAGLKPAAQGFTDAVKPTLDASSAGCLYSVAGTAGNYAINLPSAATVGAGAVIAFSVDPWATANKQYALTPVAGQTLDGRVSTTGLVLIHTNFAMLLSDGATKWITMVKKVDTDWIGDGVVQFSGSTTAPGKGATAVDAVQWRRIGSGLQARYNYRQTSAGTSGSGTMLMKLPAGFSADPSMYRSVSTDMAQSGAAAIGTACGLETYVIKPGCAILYDQYYFALACSIVYMPDSVNRGGVLTSGYWGGLAGSTLSIYANIEVQVAGW